MSKFLQWVITSIVVVVLTACGGGTPGELTAIEKIAIYAQNGGTAPTVEMYADAGVTGVTEENLNEINMVVAELNYEDVDTSAKVQALVDRLDLDITAPIFTSSATTSVAENQSSAITLQAIDTTIITYSISGGDSVAFTVDASSGVVTFSTAPDYETKSSYNFTATATNTEGNSATQNVTITITDIDEIAPVFTSSATTSVAENQTAAITMVATDATAITYSISGGDSAAFRVDSSTGVVTFTTAPDFETKTSYSFIATATDTVSNSTDQTVIIMVLNDYCTGGDEIWHMGTMYCAVTSPHTANVWLDRNLGSSQVCTDYNDTACYGDYYQWGRDVDRHEKSDSNTTDVQAVNVNDVGHGDFIESNSTYDYDWAQAADSNGSLRSSNWSKTDGSSVCPVGYRVPNIDELKAELLDAGSAEIKNSNDAFNSFLALPSAGGRDVSLEAQGSWGGIWANSVDNFNSYFIGFDGESAGSWHDGRIYGMSVRCLRD